MQSQNVREYELVRQDMVEIKECITKYMGFVLGGSGAAIFGLSALKFSTQECFALAYASSFLTVSITLVLFLLFYKFTSHNRFAGYCKLLNHERYRKNNNCSFPQLLTWEMCMDRLRASDLISAQESVEKFEDIDISEIDGQNKKRLFHLLEKLSGKEASVDKNKHTKGFKLLLKTFRGKSSSSSWGYPPFVVTLFFLLCLGFLSTGIFGTILSIFDGKILALSKLTLCVIMIIILICQYIAWRFFCGKLYSLMEGSNTVDAFYLRFIPIRTEILNELEIIPHYLYLKRHLKLKV